MSTYAQCKLEAVSDTQPSETDEEYRACKEKAYTWILKGLGAIKEYDARMATERGGFNKLGIYLNKEMTAKKSVNAIVVAAAMATPEGERKQYQFPIC